MLKCIKQFFRFGKKGAPGFEQLKKNTRNSKRLVGKKYQ